jgi:methylenetetrahydrofolate reductase (NADPH)
MRDEKRFLDGREVTDPPSIFLGAAASPSDPNLFHESLRLEKKIYAGAQFIQTQLVYDVEVLSRWMEALDKRNLLRKAHILVGIGPIRSSKVARYIQDHIPDVHIPDQFVKALDFKFARELMVKIKLIPGVSGIHIMSMRWEKVVPRLLREMRIES